MAKRKLQKREDFDLLNVPEKVLDLYGWRMFRLEMSLDRTLVQGVTFQNGNDLLCIRRNRKDTPAEITLTGATQILDVASLDPIIVYALIVFFEFRGKKKINQYFFTPPSEP